MRSKIGMSDGASHPSGSAYGSDEGQRRTRIAKVVSASRSTDLRLRSMRSKIGMSDGASHPSGSAYGSDEGQRRTRIAKVVKRSGRTTTFVVAVGLAARDLPIS